MCIPKSHGSASRTVETLHFSCVWADFVRICQENWTEYYVEHMLSARMNRIALRDFLLAGAPQTRTGKIAIVTELNSHRYVYTHKDAMLHGLGAYMFRAKYTNHWLMLRRIDQNITMERKKNLRNRKTLSLRTPNNWTLCIKIDSKRDITGIVHAEIDGFADLFLCDHTQSTPLTMLASLRIS